MRYMINNFYEVNFDHLCASTCSIFLIEALHNQQWDEITKVVSNLSVATTAIVIMIFNYRKSEKKRNNKS